MGIKDGVMNGKLLDQLNHLNHFNILHCFCTWNIEQYKINIEFICTIQSYMCDKRFDNELIKCISWCMSNVQYMIFNIEFLARWLLHTNDISIYPNSFLCDM
jgi:hypothetical protein